MARTQRSFSDYQDLASVTAPRHPAGLTTCGSGIYAYKKRDQIFPVDTA